MENLNALLAHVVSSPGLADNILKLHDMALYDSGDYPIGSYEKEVLQETKHFADLLRQVDPDRLRALMN